MVKKHVVNERPAITFYYPLLDIGEGVEKETSYVAGLLLDASGDVPRGAIFDKDDDAEWMKRELKRAVKSTSAHLVRLQHEIDSEWAEFYDVEFEEHQSCGFTINDYKAYTVTLPGWFDNALEQVIIYTLCTAWFALRKEADAMKYCLAETQKALGEVNTRHNEFFKRKKVMFGCVEPDPVLTGAVYYGILTQGRPTSVVFADLDTIIADNESFDITFEEIVGWHVVAVPSDYDERKSWYVSDLNKGDIGGLHDDPQSNTWPEPFVQEYEGVTYNVYVSSFETVFTDTVTFSNQETT